jgi:hypothetical protein
MKCHMEYEDGTPFCSNCGGDLVRKPEPKPAQEEEKKAGEVKPEGKLICPKCHLLYEKLTSCIRCGTPLVTQSALKEMEKSSPPPPPPEDKKTESKAPTPSPVRGEPSSVPSPKKPPAEPRRGEPKQPYAADLMQEPSSIEAVEKGPSKEPEDKKEKAFKLEKPKKSFFYSLHGILTIIVLLMVAIYFLITQFLTGERVRPGTPGSKETIESPDKEASTISKEASPTIPSSALPVVLLPQEIQKLLDLLENIRQANLKKDIFLLMSCYGSDYKDLEERRRTALQSWSKYNYLDLDYVLKVESLSIDSAKASVEWRIRSIPVTGGSTEEGKSVLNVLFQKEKNEWKIKEVVPAK